MIACDPVSWKNPLFLSYFGSNKQELSDCNSLKDPVPVCIVSIYLSIYTYYIFSYFFLLLKNEAQSL